MFSLSTPTSGQLHRTAPVPRFFPGIWSSTENADVMIAFACVFFLISIGYNIPFSSMICKLTGHPTCSAAELQGMCPDAFMIVTVQPSASLLWNLPIPSRLRRWADSRKSRAKYPLCYSHNASLTRIYFRNILS